MRKSYGSLNSSGGLSTWYRRRWPVARDGDAELADSLGDGQVQLKVGQAVDVSDKVSILGNIGELGHILVAYADIGTLGEGNVVLVTQGILAQLGGILGHLAVRIELVGVGEGSCIAEVPDG